MKPKMRRLAGALILGLSASAAAHPIDEVVQGAYLTLAPGEVQLELDITPGVEVAEAVLATIDTDGDHQIGPGEADAFAKAVLGRALASVDGVALAWSIDGIRMPAYASLMTGNDTISIRARATRPESVGTHSLAFENGFEPAKTQRIANIFLRPAGGWQFAVAGQRRSEDGSALTVAFTVSRP